MDKNSSFGQRLKKRLTDLTDGTDLTDKYA